MIVNRLLKEMFVKHGERNDKKTANSAQGMNAKNPTWNNLRYYFRNIHQKKAVSTLKKAVAVVSKLFADRILQIRAATLLPCVNTSAGIRPRQSDED